MHFEARVKSYGLTPAQVKAAGWKLLTAAQVKTKYPRLRFHAPAIEIPYSKDFARLRYLEPQITTAGKLTGAKPLRYAQAAGTGMHVYIPPHPVWKSKPEVTLITEGEAKALSATVRGFPTIGLGGVENWRAAPGSAKLHPTLAAHLGEQVVIVFDSDITTKPDVLRAEFTLASTILALGTHTVFTARIPPPTDGTKLGLDDFIVAGGDVAALLETAEPFLHPPELTEFAERYVAVLSPCCVWDLKHNVYETYPSLQTHSKGLTAEVKTFRATKTGTKEKVESESVFSLWEMSPLRLAVEAIDFQPGAGRFIHKVAPSGALRPALNTWSGWAHGEPSEEVVTDKDVSEFLEWTSHFLRDPAERKWLMQWIAYNFQHLNVKLKLAPVLYGGQGTGKSGICKVVAHMFGHHGHISYHQDFSSGRQSNALLGDKKIIVFDDIDRSRDREVTQFFKTTITREEIAINAKYIAEYTVRDVAGYMITTNHADALKVSDHDRRVTVIDTGQATSQSAELWNKFARWFYGDKWRSPAWQHVRKEAAQKLHRWFLDVDLTDFNDTRPLQTAAKAEMIYSARTELEEWAHQFVTDCGALGGGQLKGKPVVSATELHNCVDPQLDKRQSYRSGERRWMIDLGIALRSAGVTVEKYLDPDGKLHTLYGTDPALDRHALRRLFIATRKPKKRV